LASRISKYVAELIGTFTLVFIGTGVATLTGYFTTEAGGELLSVGDVWLAAPLAFGGTLLVLAFALGKVSGCHVNPAVTLAAGLARKMDRSDMLPYMVMQIIGGILGSAVILVMMGGMPGYSVAVHGLAAHADRLEGMSVAPALVSEVVLTMLFLLVILASTDARNLPAGFAPIPIGGFLFLAHLIGVPLGYASFNPARSLGPALLTGGTAMDRVPIFLVAPFVGALLGMFLYTMIWPSDEPARLKVAPRTAARPGGSDKEEE